MMKQVEPTVKQAKRLSKLLSRLSIDRGKSYFGAILRGQKKVCTQDVETMAVDGTHLFWNPVFMDTLPDQLAEGVLIHEAWHIMDGHPLRQGRREDELWNIACDLAINRLILKAGFKLPEGALDNPACEGLSAEQIYHKLSQEKATDKSDKQDKENSDGNQGQDSSDGDGNQSTSNDNAQSAPAAPTDNAQSAPAVDPGKCGGVIKPVNEEGSALSDAELVKAKQELSQLVSQSMQAAQKRGDMPGFLKNHIKETRDAQVDWVERIHSYAKGGSTADYTWQRLNKRRMHDGLLMPGITKKGAGEMVIGFDTSASVSDEAYAQFAGEALAIFEEVKPSAVHLLYCDTRVHPESYEGEELEDIKIVRKGYGGTSFTPVFDWVDKRIAEGEEPPQCVIYLTDGYGEAPTTEPEYPVLWVCCSSKKMPIGETVRINV